MDVKPGYKQTEVGFIPEDWEVKALGSLCEIAAGRDLVKKDFLSTGDHRHRFPIYSNALTDKGLYGYSRTYQYEPDKITVTARGDIGHAVYRSTRFCAIGRLLVLSSTQPCDLRFVTEYINNFVDFALESTGVPQLTAPQISKYSVALPPTKAEQKAIAEALSDADTLIDSLEQLIAKKRQIKQGAMQELLTGKKRLPGFSGGWDLKQIGDFTDCTAGGTPSTLVPLYWGGSIRWMSSGELHFKFVSEVAGRITENGFKNSSAKMIPKKCVLIGLAGQGKTRGTVAMNLVELCTNQSIAAIFPSAAFLPEYLYYNLDARYEELRELSTGEGGRGGLNLTIIKSIPVPLPKIGEQTAIAEILSDMYVEIVALEDKLSKARQIKLGMMQELLTGRIRLV